MQSHASGIGLAALLTVLAEPVWSQPVFVNGLAIDGGALDSTHAAGANAGRLGFFSDIYYDPAREEWWALSDRGPGGGVLPYATRVQRFEIKIDPRTGAISHFRVAETVAFRDRDGLLLDPTNPGGVKPTALNGLNPLALNGDAGTLGRSFDPDRTAGLSAGRQDNRGFEGLAITPDGGRPFAVLQDPLINEPSPNNGRDGRNLRIVAFDNDPNSPTYGQGIAQYAYQLEAQADVRQRILAAGGTASATDPRQGRNIGLSAIVALNNHEFLVLERDNRGLGVDDPAGNGVTGTKRVTGSTSRARPTSRLSRYPTTGTLLPQVSRPSPNRRFSSIWRPIRSCRMARRPRSRRGSPSARSSPMARTSSSPAPTTTIRSRRTRRARSSTCTSTSSATACSVTSTSRRS